MEDFNGIKINEMQKLYESLIEHKLKISKIINRYNEIIKNTGSYFSGDVADKYRKKYNNLSSQLVLVENSILDYSEAIQNVINKYNGININLD